MTHHYPAVPVKGLLIGRKIYFIQSEAPPRTGKLSVWNYRACFSDVICRNANGGVTKCWLYSQDSKKHITGNGLPGHYTFLGNCPPTPPLSQQ